MVGGAIVAPPGCVKVSLGVNVYPLPELRISRALTAPFVTVAFIFAVVEPGFVGACTVTMGGFVSLYPYPPSRRDTLLVPLTNAVAAAPVPVVILSCPIETFGGY